MLLVEAFRDVLVDFGPDLIGLLPLHLTHRTIRLVCHLLLVALLVKMAHLDDVADAGFYLLANFFVKIIDAALGSLVVVPGGSRF